jgi:hypothetical protein
MYACMCALLAPHRLDGFNYYSAFKSVSVISLCPMNMEIKALQMGSKTQNGDILEIKSKILMKFQ